MKYNAFNWAYYMKGSAIGGAFYVVDGYCIYLVVDGYCIYLINLI